MSFAKIIILGNLGKDVELRYTSNGLAVGNFSIASTEGVKNKDGDWENQTTWFKCTVWGKQAETCAKNLEKGSQAFVEGSLREEKWTDRDGNEKITLVVNVSDVRFLNNKKEMNEPNEPEEKDTKVKSKTKNDDVPF